MNMNKFINLIAVLSILTFSLVVATVYGSESISKGWDRSYQVSELMGSVVMNHQGKYLGRVQGFVFDPDGHITFAIIGNWRWNWRIIGENSVAVPFNELTCVRNGKRPVVMVDISWEKFQSAPKFAKADLTDRQRAEEVYKYFGQQPYWTERGSAEMGSHSMEKPMKGHTAK
jgi:sporulation protein YlmC with PRC-barrel domain